MLLIACLISLGDKPFVFCLYSGTAEFRRPTPSSSGPTCSTSPPACRCTPFKRTIKYDSKWLDKPNFVGSYDIGEHVYFFFRESAVEYINCGKSIYSRVARVCKKDTGGKNILSKNWASFLKARLNCSIPGEFPFYFNEIRRASLNPGWRSPLIGGEAKGAVFPANASSH
ncbi:semaphorin-2A [Caerostris extrusa]|uniref:Semaphorin-2A n=1 Tax=Caerostris extrusa TaxID=172846 RepID=A0AAV4PNH7_CAEEX|nr:semaphorin-2A [Caerostris extrusa]